MDKTASQVVKEALNELNYLYKFNAHYLEDINPIVLKSLDKVYAMLYSMQRRGQMNKAEKQISKMSDKELVAFFNEHPEWHNDWETFHKIKKAGEQAVVQLRADFYDLPALSLMLGIGVRTLREYIKNGELKAKKIGKAYYVTRYNFMDFISP